MSRTESLVVEPLENPLDVACPHCGQTVARAFADRCEPMQGEYWLHDADTIPARSRKTVNDVTVHGELLVGTCTCGRHYFVVDVHVTRASPDQLLDYLAHDAAIDAKRIALCVHRAPPLGCPGRWLVAVDHASRVAMHVHTLGPFPLDRLADVAGAHGVSPCQGRADGRPWQFAAALRDFIGALAQDLLGCPGLANA